MVAGKGPALNIDFWLATVVMALEPVQQWGEPAGKTGWLKFVGDQTGTKPTSVGIRLDFKRRLTHFFCNGNKIQWLDERRMLY